MNDTSRAPQVKQTKFSCTDPDAGYRASNLDHRTVDGRLGFITGTFATPANMHDRVTFMPEPDPQRDRLGFELPAVGLDSGYATTGISSELEDRYILSVTGYL